MKNSSSRTLPVILLAIFLDLVSNGILILVIPPLLADPTSPSYLLPSFIPVRYSYILLGFLIAAFPLMQFFSSPIIGEYSDHYGRKKVLAITLTLTGASFALLAMGVIMKSIFLLFAARILGGIGGGNISVAQAAIADITPPRLRAARFGLVGAAYGIGFIIGPVIGGILSDPNIVSWFDPSTPFWMASFLGLCAALLILLCMPETHTTLEKRFHVSWFSSIAHIIHAYKLKKLRGIFAANFLFHAGLTLFATFFTVFLLETFNLNQTAIGYYIAYTGIWMILTQGILLRILSKKFDEVLLLRFFLIAGAVSIFAYYFPDKLTGLLLVGACFALTNGISMAALPSLISRRSSDSIQGEILGINASLQALAQVGPPIIAGFLAAKIAPAAPVYISALIMATAWVVFIFYVKKED
jgi:DHA1 family tetracycline resistance protein-like MFS transporter